MESPRLTTPSHVRKSEDDSKFSPMLNLTTSNSDSAGDGAAHNLTGSRITRLSSSENALLSNRHQPTIKDKGENTFIAATGDCTPKYRVRAGSSDVTEDSGISSQSSPEMEEADGSRSRTHQYRKAIKPMLERKRRARINACLEELKDLMVGALQTEGESITKLEKADVLELTVRHLRKLKAHGALSLTPTTTYMERYRAGYSLCASEVSKFLTSSAGGVDMAVVASLLHRLSVSLRSMELHGERGSQVSSRVDHRLGIPLQATQPKTSPGPDRSEPMILEDLEEKAWRPW